MKKGLVIIRKLDEFCIIVMSLLFFGSWFVLGKNTDFTINSGYIVFISMFLWFFIEGLDKIVNIEDDVEDDVDENTTDNIIES